MYDMFAIFFLLIAIINIVLAVLSWQEKLSQIRQDSSFYALPAEKQQPLFAVRAKIKAGLYFLVADFFLLFAVYLVYQEEILELALVLMAIMLAIYFVVTSIYLNKQA